MGPLDIVHGFNIPAACKLFEGINPAGANINITWPNAVENTTDFVKVNGESSTLRNLNITIMLTNNSISNNVYGIVEVYKPYAVFLDTCKYENISVAIYSVADSTYALTCFYKCTNLHNCTSIIGNKLNNNVYAVSYGFHMCDRLYNCIVRTYDPNNWSVSMRSFIGFYNCYYVYNCSICIIVQTSSVYVGIKYGGYCFAQCYYMSNNIVRIIYLDVGNAKYTLRMVGYNSCKYVSDCESLISILNYENKDASYITATGFNACTVMDSCYAENNYNNNKAITSYVYADCQFISKCVAMIANIGDNSKYTFYNSYAGNSSGTAITNNVLASATKADFGFCYSLN
jgi:hypothetical protein